MSRLFWIGVGAVAGAYVTRRITDAKSRLTPSSVGAELAEGLRELGAGIGAFGAEVRAGMTTREQELNDLLERRGTVLPSYADALADPEPPRRRARRADA